MTRRSVFFLLCLCAASAVFAENGALRHVSRADWENGRLVLEVTAPLDLDRRLFPQARGAAERRIEEERSGLFLSAFSSLPLFSGATVGEYLVRPDRSNGEGRYLDELHAISGRGGKVSAVVSQDFKSLVITYEYPFHGPDGALTPLFTAERPYPLPEFAGYEASRDFSGLVIHARGKLTAIGKNAKAACRPALLPRIFYLSRRGTVEPVVDWTMVHPEALKARGIVSYVTTADPAASRGRAGDSPLTVTAHAVWGTYDTDLVISEEAARMLLARETNREFLRQGRIVVIID